jgi:ferrous iron transport protein A
VKCLSDLRVGESGRVLAVSGADEVGCRLMEMGVTPGVEVRVLGTAPFGDPIEIEVRSYRLSLRKSEAARVEIEPT